MIPYTIPPVSREPRRVWDGRQSDCFLIRSPSHLHLTDWASYKDLCYLHLKTHCTFFSYNITLRILCLHSFRNLFCNQREKKWSCWTFEVLPLSRTFSRMVLTKLNFCSTHWLESLTLLIWDLTASLVFINLLVPLTFPFT